MIDMHFFMLFNFIFHLGIRNSSWLERASIIRKGYTKLWVILTSFNQP